MTIGLMMRKDDRLTAALRSLYINIEEAERKEGRRPIQTAPLTPSVRLTDDESIGNVPDASNLRQLARHAMDSV